MPNRIQIADLQIYFLLLNSVAKHVLNSLLLQEKNIYALFHAFCLIRFFRFIKYNETAGIESDSIAAYQ